MTGPMLAVGRVAKTHGVRGEVVVDVRTDSPELRFAPGAVLGVQRRGKAGPDTLTVTAARPHAGRLLVRFESVDDMDAAEHLRGATLMVRADALEATDDPDEYHDHQLEGLRVVLPTGDEVGVVREILHTPGGELLSVRTPDDVERLIPFVSEIVPEVDLAAGRVVVDPPEGLLGDD
ncbi:ribosome maturation factor RimM [Saccharopolyspora sp. NFXS83]|uniref:ribosome maturation factor RimM n=1 Tax=Saccharopolyspora sp. NFXS83 TaxID=2993560 RepID=UPI00224AA8AF|nr:ribosome maturation factor RimM [Saccharopolyspora sp. NFXS83]MCX2733743.1 ribosome maturation factor RimM [Saccharopolyspora sp. NFXS83]